MNIPCLNQRWIAQFEALCEQYAASLAFTLLYVGWNGLVDKSSAKVTIATSAVNPGITA